MNKQLTFAFLIITLLCSTITDAQFMMRPGMGGRYRQRPGQRYRPNLPPFKPVLNFSFGYGFPNLDKTLLPDYYSVYRGSSSQKGPVTGAVDYQFSRNMGIGLMVTHGSLNVPYYEYNSSSALPVFMAKYDNWSFMLNIIRYLPVNSRTITPYIRTAIGINSWKQNYTDEAGNKMPGMNVNLPDLAYQAGIGARFYVTKYAGVFVEAGYGKYILHGGLALKF